MGSVYLATEVALGRRVAIKVLAPLFALEEEFRDRFEREARAAAGISHPNVVQVYTVGEIPGDPPIPFIIMQHIDGTPLDALLRDHGRLSEARARRLLRDVAAGLDAAHQRDLVHRDVKPANILIERATGRALLTDFGISAALSPRAIGGAEPMAESGVVGTPPYMSPEQTFGEPPDVRSDIYSLGVVAYETLAGALPFEARSATEWMAAHQSKHPKPLRDHRRGVSDGLAQLVMRCLAKDPARRPRAADLSRELLPSAEDEILWPPPGLLSLPRVGRQLRRIAAALVAAAAVLIAELSVRIPGTHTAVGWWQAWAGGGVIATNSAQTPPTWAVVLWETIAVLAALTLAGALIAFFIRLSTAIRASNEHRSRGWRWETLGDALADPDGRTGLLISGAAEFAAMRSDDRERIRAHRRMAFATLVASGAWIALALGVWSVSVLAGAPLQSRGGPPAGVVASLTFFGPLLIGVAAAAQALVRERRLNRPFWRRPHSGTFAIPSDADGEDIAAWYAMLPQALEPLPARPRSSPRLARAVQIAVAAMSVWTIAALALLMTATLLAGRLARRFGPDTARIAQLIESESNEAALGDVVRHALAGVRRDSSVKLAGHDGNPLETLVAGGSLPEYSIAPRRILGSKQLELTSATLVSDAVRRARAIPRDTLDLLRQLGEHPRTRALREAARAGGTIAMIAEDSAFAIRTAMEANAAAAVAAFARGAYDDATARLSDNATIAELALASPNRHWSETGLRMLHSLVLAPLAEAARLRGDAAMERALRSVAGRVVEAIDRYGFTWTVGAIGLASDPRELGLLQRLQRDSTVPPGFRRSAIEAAGEGVCLNPREWLAGADRARHSALSEGVALPESFRSPGIAFVVARIRHCAAL